MFKDPWPPSTKKMSLPTISMDRFKIPRIFWGLMSGAIFLHDAITNNFSTLDTTLKDVQALETPVMYISAGRDAWINDTDLQTFKQSIGFTFVKVVGRSGGIAPSSRKSKNCTDDLPTHH